MPHDGILTEHSRGCPNFRWTCLSEPCNKLAIPSTRTAQMAGVAMDPLKWQVIQKSSRHRIRYSPIIWSHIARITDKRLQKCLPVLSNSRVKTFAKVVLNIESKAQKSPGFHSENSRKNVGTSCVGIKCPRLHFPIPILSRTVLSTVVSPKKNCWIPEKHEDF